MRFRPLFCVFDQLPAKIEFFAWSRGSSRGSFSKKNCPKRTFPSNFVKLVSKILYLFLAEKMVVCCCLFVVCCLFVATLSDFGLLFFKLKLSSS